MSIALVNDHSNSSSNGYEIVNWSGTQEEFMYHNTCPDAPYDMNTHHRGSEVDMSNSG